MSKPKNTVGTRIIGYTFENQNVVLDFNQYEDCVFKNCTMIYHGLGPIGLVSSKMSGCNWGFQGPASMTLKLIADLYTSEDQDGSMKRMLDQLFADLRKGESPPIEFK